MEDRSRLKRGGLYPGEHSDFLRTKDDNWFTWDGEPPRPILPGEYYFSGAEVTAYRYAGATGEPTSTPYHPATRVKIVPCPYCRGTGKVREPRS